MIDPWIYPALTAVAVLTGFIDAIAGGGGLIMLPALLFAGVPPLNALATNKLQSMFGTATALLQFRPRRPGRLAPEYPDHCAGVRGRVRRGHPDPVGRPRCCTCHPGLLIAVALYFLLSPRMTDEDAHQRLSQGYTPPSRRNRRL